MTKDFGTTSIRDGYIELPYPKILFYILVILFRISIFVLYAIKVNEKSLTNGSNCNAIKEFFCVPDHNKNG